MDLNRKSKLDSLLNNSLDKFETLDNAITDALDTLDPSSIRPTALAQLLQVKLQYLQFFNDLKKDSELGDNSNDVLDILQKAPPELREEFLDVWQRILVAVQEAEEGSAEDTE